MNILEGIMSSDDLFFEFSKGKASPDFWSFDFPKITL